jgi:hypothetical protein
LRGGVSALALGGAGVMSARKTFQWGLLKN